MNRFAWLCVAVLGAGACDADDVGHVSPDADVPDATLTPLPIAQIDVEVTPTTIAVSAIEVQGSACAYPPFLRTGCDLIADVRGCDRHVDYVATVTLEQDGGPDAVLTLDTFNTPRWRFDRPAGGAVPRTIVIATDDGQTVRIPIPAAATPVPTIRSMTTDDDTLRVDWTATPTAATALVQVGNPNIDMYTRRCHVTGPAAAEFVYEPGGVPAGRTVYVTSYATVSTTSTVIGEAKVWIGAQTSATTPRPD